MLDVRRPVAEGRDRVGDERVDVGELGDVVVARARSRSSTRSGGRARSRRRASRRGARARPRPLAGSVEQALVQRAVELAGALGRARPRGRGGRRRRRTASRPVSTATGSPPWPRSRITNDVCSGRWPACRHRLDLDLAEAQDPAVVEGLVLVLGVGEPVDVDRWRRSRGASRPCPETWSAWLWVSSTCSIRTPCRRERCRYGSMSHCGSTTAAIPSSTSPTRYEAQPEVLVDHLAEEHRDAILSHDRVTLLSD